MSKDPVTPEKLEHGNAWLNIGKIIFLIAVLVAAGLVLERLLEGKQEISRRTNV